MNIPWHKLLNNHLPGIKRRLQIFAIRILADKARKGDPRAASYLSLALVDPRLRDIQDPIAQALRPPLSQASLNQMWSVWRQSRQPDLTKLLLEHAKPASAPNHLRIYSLMQLGRMKPAAQLTAADVEVLAQATSDSDPFLSMAALHALESLKKQEAIDCLCRLWVNSRSNILQKIILDAKFIATQDLQAQVYSTLINNHAENLFNATAEMVDWLVTACLDPHPVISTQAQIAIRHLQNPQAIERFCAIWAEKRHPTLENALIYAHYLPRPNPYLRLLCAIKTNDIELAKNCPPNWIPDLLRVCHDSDPQIREQAITAASTLNQADAQSALCELFITTNDSLLTQILQKAHYLPQDIEKRVLIFFLSMQWQCYEELDFDQQIMRTIYRAAPLEMRDRIMNLLQTAGKTNYLTILTGKSTRTGHGTFSPQENQILIHTLSSNQEWSKLWDLCFQVEPSSSLEILRILEKENWQPSLEIDHSDFQLLIKLLNHPLPGIDTKTRKTSKKDWLPFAIPQATLKVHNRANCIAFSPHNFCLAIGSSTKRILIWDLQRAIPVNTISGFNHSIGNVTYHPDGTLLCSERSNLQTECSFYVCRANEPPQKIGAHPAAITSLIPLNAETIFSSGRDGTAALWDFRTQKLIQQRPLSNWPRFACASPQFDRVSLLSDQIDLIDSRTLASLPSPKFRGNKTFATHGILSTAAFANDSETLVTGSHSGEIISYQNLSAGKGASRTMIAQKLAPLKSLVFASPYLISASQDGQINIFSTSNHTLSASIATHHKYLISLQVSDDQTFMATGGKEEIVIWDLRSPLLEQVFSQPLIKTTHQQAAVVLSYLHNPNLPAGLKNSLEFLKILLIHKLRYDILIETTPIIQSGEFDIELG